MFAPIIILGGPLFFLIISIVLHHGHRNFSVAASIASLATWLIVFMFSAMLFDAPGSEKNTFLKIFARMIQLFPVIFILTWVIFGKTGNYYTILIPVIWVMAAVFFCGKGFRKDHVMGLMQNHISEQAQEEKAKSALESSDAKKIQKDKSGE